MIREGLEYLFEQAQGRILKASGRNYSTTELKTLPSPASLAETIEIHTLTGFVDYVKSGLDGNMSKNAAVFVLGPCVVSLRSALYSEFKQREEYITARSFDYGTPQLGRYIDVEAFIVDLQTHFIATNITASILKIVGNVQSEAVQTVVDDGVSQMVSARKGITKAENTVLPIMLNLQRYRTFPEIEQPMSRYVFRMKNGKEGGLPLVALFEVDDNRWKVETVQEISKYLEKADLGVPVFG